MCSFHKTNHNNVNGWFLDIWVGAIQFPLVKFYATNQLVRIEVFDLYLKNETFRSGKNMLNMRVMSNSFTITGVILLKMNKRDIVCLGIEFSRHAFLSPKIIPREIHGVFR